MAFPTNIFALELGDTPWQVLKRLALFGISYGPIPQHIAFILDGNRRYAKQLSLPIATGHAAGADKLFDACFQMLSVCYGIGVKEISAYLFSLENFKRSPQEVEDLMRVMEFSLKRVIQKGGLLHRLNIQLRVVGRRDCLPKWFLEIIDEAICLTSRYDKGYLNLCIAYTGRDEITSAIQATAIDHVTVQSRDDGTTQQYQTTNGISCEGLNGRMWMAESLPLDLMIRTSGTNRLSDFMLWHCHESTEIVFLDCNWPAMTFWGFFKVLVLWQRRAG